MTPENLSTVIVGLIVTNLASVGTAVGFLFKQVLWAAKLEFRLESAEKDLTAAFQKIRDLELRK